MTFVTSYKSPDLDGIACTIAYAELLTKQHLSAIPVYYGDLGLEVKFLKDYLGGIPIKPHTGSFPTGSDFVLVDTADPDAIDPAIPLAQVKEIFDHRKLVFVEKFTSAVSHIELVGSCATLITEEIVRKQIQPGRVSATFLYGAIISNTVNFKNSVTTDRDRKAASWLEKQISLPPDFIKNMFQSKSQINVSNLEQVILQDFAVKNIAGKIIGIAQIEVVDLEKLVSSLKPQLLEILGRLKAERGLDYIFFTGVDILEGFNHFLVIDKDSAGLFSHALSLPGLTSEVKTTRIIMRKQIWPLLEKSLESTSNLKLVPDRSLSRPDVSPDVNVAQ